MWSFSIVDEKPEKIEKVKEDGPPADPSTAKISSNKESIIEINANNKGLGLFVTGGKMIQPPVVSNMPQIETICMSNSLLMKKIRTSFSTGWCICSLYLSKRCCQY